MEIMSTVSLSKISLIIVCVGIFLSCTKPEQYNQVIDIDEIQQIYPSQITKFDKVDKLYFSFLGIKSFPHRDGSFVLSMQNPARLIHISEDGKNLLAKTSSGRGPGEIMEFDVPVIDRNSNIHVYDRTKSINLIFDSELNLIDEFQIASHKDLYVKTAHRLGNGNYMVQMTSIQWIIDPNKMKYMMFSLYNEGKKKYSKDVKFIDRQYAQSKNPAPPAPTKPYAEYLGGDRAISYSAKQLYSLSKHRESIYLYNTGSDLIAEVDFNFDTLRTITVNLPIEKISNIERDSISNEISEVEIKNDLINRLPKFKTPVEHMIIDHKSRFWLKSNLRGENDRWFVLNKEGGVEKVVNLPKKSFITHISEKHIGVRLDDTNFALYDTVN